MTTPQSVLERLKGVFEEKNEDYGNSWEKVGVVKRVIADDEGPTVHQVPNPDATGSITGRRVGEEEPEVVYVGVPIEHIPEDGTLELVELAETPDTSTTFQQNVDDLFTRLLDKLIRSYNLTLMKDEPQLDNESTLDAWEDMTGYSAMGTSLVERQRYE